MQDRDTIRRNEAQAFGLVEDASWDIIYQTALENCGLYVRTRQRNTFFSGTSLVVLLTINLSIAALYPVIPIVLTGLLAIYVGTGSARIVSLAATYFILAVASILCLKHDQMPLYYLFSQAPALTVWFIMLVIQWLAVSMRSYEVYFLETAPEEIRQIHLERQSGILPRGNR